MQYLTDQEIADEILAASRRNEYISRHVQMARREILLGAIAALALISVSVGNLRFPLALVALGGFVVGWLGCSILRRFDHLR